MQPVRPGFRGEGQHGLGLLHSSSPPKARVFFEYPQHRVPSSEGFHTPLYGRTSKSRVLQGRSLRPPFVTGAVGGTLGET